MRQILPALLMMFTVLDAFAAQGGPFLVSTNDTSKGGVQAFVKEDSAGVRQLQAYVAAGTSRAPERIRSEDVTVRAFDETGKELELTNANVNGEALMAICNGGSCNAIKTYYFSVPKADTDRVRKVIVMFRNSQYELTMEKYPRPKN